MRLDRRVRRFTKTEDELILSHFKEHLNSMGYDFCINALFKIFKGCHSKRAIRDRWKNFLSKDADSFTAEEDMLILYLHENLGNKWAYISRCLKNRSSTQVRIRYNQLIRENNQVQQNDTFDNSFFDFYDDTQFIFEDDLFN